MIVVFACTGSVSGQKENNTWVFGAKAGLDFNAPGNPLPLTTAISQSEGCASFSDPATGQLLFYTDGNKIWNASHQVMPNGTLGIMTFSTAQAALILPFPGNPGRYYVFSLGHVYNNSPDIGKLYYSVVDMSLNGGLGDVVPGQKKILLDTGLREALAAVHGCRSDWLLVNTRIGNTFKVYPVTPAGIGVPVLSPVGSARDGYPGVIKISPDGRKLTFSGIAVIIGGTGDLTLYDFDAATGSVSNPVPVSQRFFYGICFSPDNTKLYGITTTLNASSRLYQYDITPGNTAAIQASEADLGATPSGQPSDIQAGPDGKLYLGCNSAAAMDRVNFPNLAGAACDYVHQVVALAPGTSMRLGLPNIVVRAAGKDTFTSVAPPVILCRDGEGYLPVMLQARPGYTGYLWEDGDTAAGRPVSVPGVYRVVVTDTGAPCQVWLDSFIAAAGPDLRFSLGEDITTIFCDHPDSYVALEVNIPGAAYRWQDGSTDRQYHARRPGIYRAEVMEDGCMFADTIVIRDTTLSPELGPDVRVCNDDRISITLQSPPVLPGTEIRWSNGSSAPSIQAADTGLYWIRLVYAPCIFADSMRITSEICTCFIRTAGAFTPNGDGRNDMFLPVIEAGCPVNQYTLSIYNRFGQRVFYSTDPAQGWDGWYNGVPADIGVYYYELHFAGGTRGASGYEKGDLTLLR